MGLQEVPCDSCFLWFWVLKLYIKFECVIHNRIQCDSKCQKLYDRISPRDSGYKFNLVITVVWRNKCLIKLFSERSLILCSLLYSQLVSCQNHGPPLQNRNWDHKQSLQMEFLVFCPLDIVLCLSESRTWPNLWSLAMLKYPGKLLFRCMVGQ